MKETTGASKNTMSNSFIENSVASNASLVGASAAIKHAHASALRSISRVVEETTIPTKQEIAVKEIAAQLREKSVLVLTGAGISTDSGIPDYRGPNGSLTRHRPMTYQEFRHDKQALHRYWARAFVGWRQMAQAQPNNGHLFLAELERAGMIHAIITQNVDGLHTRAGSKNVVAIHGDMSLIVCLDCGQKETRTDYEQRAIKHNPGYLESIKFDPAMVNPDGDVYLSEETVARFNLIGCTHCGSLMLKPDVVYFGEPVPSTTKRKVAQLLKQSSSVLVIGSSLAVMSGMRIIIDAQKQGKKVAVINGGPGRADTRADIVWRSSITAAFSQLKEELSL
ncbi:sir2-like regulatory protein [Corynebacterium kutscheri]|uniref:protein acetyllysine N-acetyltransferase n=1 Tax=Corynebacterium kutscheri TaxID=35755 RepID=A0A0F6R090_9CORY|nr:Sir2 family NAD-dependent protein deacetylase [Corynebacterium kutscheri]AKE40293.1 NAD-dependent protein deacetylase, SIR2 family [Corynebacterium kutscheri]VEH05500.1 sir2-like regulatory protein [Corynebacterium kutscheri]VEH10685.1 sir2-like regulatory protein [Corynebacterium kutscheri]VEH81393.1 sir2-like regulatory protein [Corynebacterium kutscheri]